MSFPFPFLVNQSDASAGVRCWEDHDDNHQQALETSVVTFGDFHSEKTLSSYRILQMCTVYCIRYAEEICNVVGMGLPNLWIFMVFLGMVYFFGFSSWYNRCV